jgi:hypothetical protein
MEHLLTNPFFLVFACVTLTSVVATIAHYWHKISRDELEASLKLEMIQKGMSADDVVKVLKATREKTPRRADECDGAETSSPSASR